MRIILKPGETLTVGFTDGSDASGVGRDLVDGTLDIAIGTTEITVSASMPDTSGREGVIYQEVFGAGIPAPDEEALA